MDSMPPAKILVDQYCFIAISNSSLILQNVNIIFQKKLADSPFKILSKSFLNMEVRLNIKILIKSVYFNRIVQFKK